MVVSLYILIIAALYYMGYIMSLYSAVAYVEPERMEDALGNLSSLKQKYLNEIQDNPRASIQLSTIFKSLVLVLVSVVAILIANRIVYHYQWQMDFVVIGALFLVWVIYLVILEIMPSRRVLAMNGNRFKYISLYVGVYMLFKPLLSVYSGIVQRDHNDKISEDQKEDIIERAIETLAEQAGIDEPIVEDDEKEMIGQIFQLDVTEVREVMVPRINITGLPKDTTIEQIQAVTREVGYSRFPVFEESPDKIVGILYIKDLFTALNNGHGEINISKYIRDPFFVSEKKKISELLTEFKANKVHIAIVVDEYGGTSGLVTLEDILEEIFGEIQDEHDLESDPLVHLPDNSIRVDASVSVEDLIEELKLDYEIGEFETVGGLIYDLVGSVPSAGTVLKWKDIIFEIDKVDGQRIVSIKTWVKKATD